MILSEPMILREKETGMVIEQAVVAPTNGGGRSTTYWYQVTGIVREPGASKFAVGQPIAWPYAPEDWEEVIQ